MDAKNYIKRNTKQGLMLNRRLCSGKATLSYFGGFPTLPEYLEWPSFKDYQRGLPFIGQIDLRDLPHVTGNQLPTDGVLFFFAGQSNVADEMESRVLYAPRSGNVPNVAPKPKLPLWKLGDYEIWSPSPFGSLECLHSNPDFPEEEPIFHLPKFELAIQIVDTIRNPYRDEMLANDPNLIDAIERANYRLSKRTDTNLEGLGMPVAKGASLEEWSASSTNWPWAWIVIELIIRRTFRPKSGFHLFKGLAESELHQMYLEAQDWLQLALKKGRFTAVSIAEGERFRKWLYGLYARKLRATGKTELRVCEVLTQLWPKRLAYDFLDITKAGIALMLDGCNPARGLLSQQVLNENASEISKVKGHQMFGYGFDSQSPPPQHYENVLLLQVSTDWGMLMQWGDCKALQFCISEDDAQTLRFDRSYCWICG